MANIFNFFVSLFKKKVSPETIKVELKGTAATFNITYKIKNKKPIQNPEVKSGWTNSFKVKSGDYYYFSAQANSRNATVQLTTFYNGEVIKENSKTGDYPLTTVSSTLE